jgi:hypothetical protein
MKTGMTLAPPAAAAFNAWLSTVRRSRRKMNRLVCGILFNGILKSGALAGVLLRKF